MEVGVDPCPQDGRGIAFAGLEASLVCLKFGLCDLLLGSGSPCFFVFGLGFNVFSDTRKSLVIVIIFHKVLL